MKRSLTKSLKRRIAQSTAAIHENVMREHSRNLTELSTASVRFTREDMIKHFKRISYFLLGLFVTLCLSLMLVSCNVTRVISNESQYYQRGDTSVVIQTKTIETYDATKKL